VREEHDAMGFRRYREGARQGDQARRYLDRLLRIGLLHFGSHFIHA
jgi:hypothetical protein